MKNAARITEVLMEVGLGDNDQLPQIQELFYGLWLEVSFGQLRRGDVFRLWDLDENGKRHPDRCVNGEHDVCMCFGTPTHHVNEHGDKTLSVKCESVITRHKGAPHRRADIRKLKDAQQ